MVSKFAISGLLTESSKNNFTYFLDSFLEPVQDLAFSGFAVMIFRQTRKRERRYSKNIRK
jgi:hypothetical protein